MIGKYQQISSQNTVSKWKRWSASEKQQLLNTYQIYPDNWQKISMIIGRTQSSCLNMFNKLKINSKQQINVNKYSQQEDDMIIELYTKYPQNWSIIVSYFPQKQQKAIIKRYKYLNKINSLGTNRTWTIQQDQLLNVLVGVLKFNWIQISKLFDRCTQSNCYFRYQDFIKYKIIWNFQEDKKLYQLYKTYNGDFEQISKIINVDKKFCKERYNRLRRISLKKQLSMHQFQQIIQKYDNWIQIHKRFPFLSQRQCYFAYENYQRQQLISIKRSKSRINSIQKKKFNTKQNKKNYWTFDEDDKLLQFVQQHQFAWQKIANLFDRKRSSSNCKIRYFFLQRILSTTHHRDWTQEEDRKLTLYAKSVNFSLKTITSDFDNCTIDNVYLRYRQLMKKNEQLKKQIYKNQRVEYEKRQQQCQEQKKTRSKLGQNNEFMQMIVGILQQLKMLIKLNHIDL